MTAITCTPFENCVPIFLAANKSCDEMIFSMPTKVKPFIEKVCTEIKDNVFSKEWTILASLYIKRRSE